MTDNPLREGLRMPRTAPACIVVIFGASGDLTRRKLVPALYSLARQNLLAGGFTIVGTARSDMTHDAFRASMREAVQEFFEDGIDAAVWDNFARGIYYYASNPGKQESYENLKGMLAQIDHDRGTSGNRLYYLATPPTLYCDVIRLLGATGLNKTGNSWVRLIVEKPFGRDLATANALNREILQAFHEDQIYRIDHYLGKETVQNLIVLRFANGIFEPLWNQRYIDHVQLTAAESIGVENRGGYYDQAGALRDMIQNHMMQLLTLVAMEPPVAMEANAVRDEKVKVLRALRDITAQEASAWAVRGQYSEGAVGGEPVNGYRQETNVDGDSRTETFAVVKFLVDNWRWAEVPFYLRSGKRLPKRVTEIAIQFKKVPHLLFKYDASGPIEPNSLIVRIQPDEGISLKFGAKLPGQAMQIRPVSMDFQYGPSFGKKSPEAYERLLLDALVGDSTLYARGDMLELSWELMMPILEAWEKSSEPPPLYESGSWGPREADELIQKDGRRWRRP